MKEELISIIVPIYNVRDYLDKCIMSLLDQSYKKIEIILINDGSNDGSDYICNYYAGIHECIRVIHRTNGGLSVARNSGLALAKGKYCIFVDGDDSVLYDMVETLYHYVSQQERGLVVCGYVGVNEEGDVVKRKILIDHIYLIEREKDKYEFLLQELLSYNVPWEVWNKIYCVDVIRENEIVFRPNNLIFAEDMLFNLEYVLHCNKVITLKKSLYKYLIRDRSIMGINQGQALVNEFCNMGMFYYQYLIQYPLPYFKENFCFLFGAILYNRFIHLENNRKRVMLHSIKEKEFYMKQLVEIRYRCLHGESPWDFKKTIQLLNMIESALNEKKNSEKLNYKMICLMDRAYKRFF